jgi:glutathione S-transferase
MPHVLHEVDTLKDDNNRDPYLKENPTGQVPTMLHGNFKIIGATNIFLGYLASCVPKIRERFMGCDKSEMDNLLVWYLTRLRPLALRLSSSISRFKEGRHISKNRSGTTSGGGAIVQ